MIRILVALLALTATALAAAPLGRFTVASDTVLDAATGLTWQRAPSPTNLTWTDAVNYCQTLSLSGGGWRLPGTKELESIIDVRASNPSIDGTAFPSTPSVVFWTSTLDSTDSALAWRVHFGDGNADTFFKTQSYRARCVR